MAVHLLTTGGTIASKVNASGIEMTGGAELLSTLPPRWALPEVVVEDLAARPSWDLDTEAMVGIARQVRAAVVERGAEGVVVTHGTDTMEETAFLTDLLSGEVAGRAGLIFTGAMRWFTDPSADGPWNLATALTSAAHASLRGAGVLVAMNEQLHAARWVHKADARGIAAFTSWPHAPVGTTRYGRPRLEQAPLGSLPHAGQSVDPAVALVTGLPGLGAGALRAALDGGAHGIVLEGVGNSNVASELFPVVEEATRAGVPVVVASRCATPRLPLDELGPGAGEAGRHGAIGAMGLPAAKARIALMVALGAAGGAGADGPDPVGGVRRWFDGL